MRTQKRLRGGGKKWSVGRFPALPSFSLSVSFSSSSQHSFQNVTVWGGGGRERSATAAIDLPATAALGTRARIHP